MPLAQGSHDEGHIQAVSRSYSHLKGLTGSEEFDTKLTVLGLSLSLPHDIAVSFTQGELAVATGKGRESTPKTCAIVLKQLILRRDIPYPCYILFTKGNSEDPVITEGKEDTRGREHQEAKSLRS